MEQLLAVLCACMARSLGPRFSRLLLDLTICSHVGGLIGHDSRSASPRMVTKPASGALLHTLQSSTGPVLEGKLIIEEDAMEADIG